MVTHWNPVMHCPQYLQRSHYNAMHDAFVLHSLPIIGFNAWYNTIRLIALRMLFTRLSLRFKASPFQVGGPDTWWSAQYWNKPGIVFWGFIVCSLTHCHCGCVTTKAAHFVFIVLCFLALCLSAVRGVTVSGVFNAHNTCSRRWRAGWLGSELGIWRGQVGGHQHQGGYGKKKWCFTVLGDSNTQCCEAT